MKKPTLKKKKKFKHWLSPVVTSHVTKCYRDKPTAQNVCLLMGNANEGVARAR